MCTRKDECPDLPTNSQYGDGEAAARRSARKPAVDWQDRLARGDRFAAQHSGRRWWPDTARHPAG